MTGALLLLWSCSASQPESGDGAQECGPASLAEEGCSIDPCAAECSSVVKGVDCCIESYGRGNFDDYNLELLAAGCSGSECDPDQYLSPEAALCVAQVYGLESGIGWCGSSFEFLGDDEVWTSRSTYLNECSDGRELGDVGYKLILIEARTAEYMDNADEVGLAECPD